MQHTYRNPVLDSPCPDPYVLYHRGTYWAWCSGPWSDGRVFGTWRSPDLVHWQEVGGALLALPGGHPCYWAPEVIHVNGRFYMYFSVGDEVHMELRVATADAPEGPFIDSGHRLTDVPFAIDAHVFTDTDGQRWMFYATDFVEDDPIGTGTVCDRMVDLFTLEGRPRVVSRAAYDWQVYDAARAEKGGVRWHTVEGPCVLRHKGLYYQMFSGGNWTNVTYGVGYATSASVSAAGWRQHCDGVRVQPLLRTIPGMVVGPGHNSAVLGPDRMQTWCVYHRWTPEMTERVMAIDRLDWAGERLMVLGPTSTPQPPPTPARRLFGEGGWSLARGAWHLESDRLAQTAPNGSAEAIFRLPSPSTVIELWMRAGGRTLDPLLNQVMPLQHEGLAPESRITLRLPPLELHFSPAARRVEIRQGDRVDRLSLPDVDLTWPHAVLLQVDGPRVAVTLDARLLWQGVLDAEVERLALATSQTAAEFEAGRLTVGWEETFSPVEGDGLLTTWEVAEGHADAWRVDEHLLRRVADTPPSRLRRGPHLERYEWVVNVRAKSPAAGCWRLWPLEQGPSFALEGGPGAWRLAGGEHAFELPADFDPAQFHQVRFRREARRLAVQVDTLPLGEVAVAEGPSGVALEADSDTVAFDLVRLTALPLEQASTLG